MSARVTWTGLSEFKTDLRNMPEHLADKAGVIVVATAQQAERDIEAAYPEGPTGNLKRGVRTTVEGRTGAGASALVRSTARHAHIFEKGTETRRTGKGANRGRMPPAPASQQMIPIVVRARRQMVAQLIHMVQTEGFTVTAS